MKEDLTIKQISELKTAAENRINEILEDFQSETGVWFESIEIVSIDSSLNSNKSVFQHTQAKIFIPWPVEKKSSYDFNKI